MKLEVHLWDRRVGTLSDEAGVGGIPFQYAGEWLDGGFNISPFALEWGTRVQWREGDRTFEGLHGVFSDSLPDAWGNDHAKNHAFLRKPQEEWTLSPAYDVMFSRPGAGNGLHRQMPVMGQRQGISVAHIREMGRRHGLKSSVMTSTLDQIAEAAAAWENIASSLGIDEIRMHEIRNAWEPIISEK